MLETETSGGVPGTEFPDVIMGVGTDVGLPQLGG